MMSANDTASTPGANNARFTLTEIVTATGGALTRLPEGATAESSVEAVSTDTRALPAGALFIALRGEHSDGHDYLEAAAKHGARAVLVEKKSADKAAGLPSSVAVIEAEDTLRALGELAALHRQRFQIPVVAVTGSYGKTTTRAMVAAALSATRSVLTSESNFNNEVGVPQTLLQLDETHEVAVIEMGMRGQGQIEYLAQIAQPTVGVITNIGPQHIELLGSVENIAEAKAEILRFLPEDGAAILPADDEYLDFFTDQVHAAQVIRFGHNPSAEYGVNHIETGDDGHIVCSIHSSNSEVRKIHLPLPGEHNANNAAAALAVAGVLEVPLEAAARALEKVEVPGGRMRITRSESRGITIIDDCYNAGPTSMRAALQTLRDFPNAGRRVAILGAMKELGDHSRKEHRAIGALAAHCAEIVVGVGEETKVLLEEAEAVGAIPLHTEWCEDANSVAAELREWLRTGDVVLVKGSRSVGLETVVEALVGEEQ